jgi:DNA processing protein
MKINTIAPDKHNYLQIISTIAKSPKRLDFIGTLPENRITSVAIVGTRKPTPYGKEIGHMLAYELAKRGVAIISGLALGIDAIAHRGALEAGGVTLAVLGNGLDTIYPASHKDLARQIIEKGGALISEYPPEELARPYYFLERNRIVSGLSDAVIVIEAAARSGTLNTAAHALEQGEEIFAVPGNITSPLSTGCNALLKQGAHPATCVEDILEVIAPTILNAQSVLPLGSTPGESSIIALLQQGIRGGEELQKASGLAISEFNQTLTMLEINGIIRSLGGNQWALR